MATVDLQWAHELGGEGRDQLDSLYEGGLVFCALYILPFSSLALTFSSHFLLIFFSFLLIFLVVCSLCHAHRYQAAAAAGRLN